MVEKHSKQGTAEEKLNMQDVLSMRSSGYYSQRTAGAKNAIDSVLPLMKEAVNNLPETEILRFADYGAADGGTSAALWADLISSLRKGGDVRHTELLTQIYHQMIFLPCSRRCKGWKVILQMPIR